MNIDDIRSPYNAGRSQYDMETGICLVNAAHINEESIIDPRVEVEFLHESIHWLTEAMTSIGQFIVFLKSTKNIDLFLASYTNDDVHNFLKKALQNDSPGSCILQHWENFDYFPTIFHNEKDAIIHNWIGLFRADALLSHWPRIPHNGEALAWTITGSLEHYSQWLNRQDYLDNNYFTPDKCDHFIHNSLSSYHYRNIQKYQDILCSTVDIFEAIGVCSEFIWAQRNNITDIYGQSRLEEIFDSSYMAPIKMILRANNDLVSLKSIMINLLPITIILEAALNPPIPPLENSDPEIYSFEHVYPPLRLLRFLNENSKQAQFTNTSRPTGFTFDETAQKYLYFVYNVMDPPGRTWKVHVTENNDEFSAFKALPQREQLENMYFWFHKKRIITPYSLRLWASLKLKLPLSDKDIQHLSQVLFCNDLKDLTNYSEPVLTLLQKKIKPGASLISIHSHLFTDPEVLEWYLVNTAIQYSFVDALLGNEKPNYCKFLGKTTGQETEWGKELERRISSIINSVFS